MRTGRIVSSLAFEQEEAASAPFESFQAKDLKQSMLTRPLREEKRASRRSIAIVSGKGGVGKSNFALNLALVLGESFGVRSAIIDADLGLANADVLLGLETRLSMAHVLRGELSVRDILVPVSERVWLVPGGSGITEFSDMTPDMKRRFVPEMLSLDDLVDVMVIDAGAGIQSAVLECALAADVVVLVTTPEPTALKDAYSMLKNLMHYDGSRKLKSKDLFLLVNMAFSEKEAFLASERLAEVSKRFLALELPFLGYLPHDLRITRSVKAKCPVVRMYPKCPISRKIGEMAGKILSLSGERERTLDTLPGQHGPMRNLMLSLWGNSVFP